jgi:quercetin dioxygenase-like cupin family protein
LSLQSHPRPTRPLTAEHLLAFDIAAEVARLKEETEWKVAGRNAITLVKEHDLRVVMLVLQAGLKLDEHHSTGPITLQVISGTIVLRAVGRAVNVTAGGLLVAAANVVHDVEALEESAFLLTIVQPPRLSMSAGK